MVLDNMIRHSWDSIFLSLENSGLLLRNFWSVLDRLLYRSMNSMLSLLQCIIHSCGRVFR